MWGPRTPDSLIMAIKIKIQYVKQTEQFMYTIRRISLNSDGARAAGGQDRRLLPALNCGFTGE